MVLAILTRFLVALSVIIYGPEYGCLNTQPTTLALAQPIAPSNTCSLLLPIQLSYFTPFTFTHPVTPVVPVRTIPKALPLNVCAPLLPIQRLTTPIKITTINDIAAAIGPAGPGGCALVSMDLSTLWSLGRGKVNAAFREISDGLTTHLQNRPCHPLQSTWHILNALWSSTTGISTSVIIVQLLIIIRQWLLLRRARQIILSKERTVTSLLKSIFEDTRKFANLDALVADLRNKITQQDDNHAKLMKTSCKKLLVFKMCVRWLHNLQIKARDEKIEKLGAQLAQALRTIQDMIADHATQLAALKTKFGTETQRLSENVTKKDLQIDRLTAQLTQKADELDKSVKAKDDEIRVAKEGWDAALLGGGQLREELQSLEEQLRQRSLDIEELEGLRESNLELIDIVDQLEEETSAQEAASLLSTPAMTIDDGSSSFMAPSDITSGALSRDLPILRAASSRRRVSAEFGWLRSLKKALRKDRKTKAS